MLLQTDSLLSHEDSFRKIKVWLTVHIIQEFVIKKNVENSIKHIMFHSLFQRVLSDCIPFFSYFWFIFCQALYSWLNFNLLQLRHNYLMDKQIIKF